MRVGTGEGSPLEEEGWVKNQMLYRVSLADQEYLAFSLWSHKWKASVTAQTKPGSPDCLTATLTKKETVYWPWPRLTFFYHQDSNLRGYMRLLL